MKSMKKIICFNLILAAIAILITSLITSCDSKLVSIDGSNPPYDLNIEKTAEGEIKLTWKFNAVADDTISYTVDKRIGTSFWITPYAITENKFFTDYIPTNDTLVYAYRVQAVNSTTSETSEYSQPVAYFSEYTYPQNLIINQISQEQLEITWQDKSIGEEGFAVDKKIGTGNWQNRYRVFPANTTSFVDPADLYQQVYYRIYAFVGDSRTDKLEADYLPSLPAPSDLELQQPDETKIKLLWTDNSEGEDGFMIDRKVGELDWIVDYAQVSGNITSWIDNIDFPCGVFSYRIRAFEGQFISLYSEEATTSVFLNEVGSWETSGEPAEVFISQETNWYSFVADKYYGFTIIDCVNPSELIGMNYNEGGLPDRTQSVFVRDNLAYITTSSGLDEHGQLFIVDLEPVIPFHPFDPPDVLWIVGYCPITANEEDTFIPYDIYLDGDHAYVADGENGLCVIYIASSNPYFIANCQTGGTARNVFVKNDKAYVASKSAGLVVVNVTDPYNPAVEKTYPTTGSTMDVSERDGFLYLADGENGLKIINTFTDETSYINTGGFAVSIYVQGQDRYQEDHVYLIDKENGLYVIDISDPENPYILGSLAMDNEPISISKFFYSSYVFIADNSGMRIVQIAP
ncbi:MAG: hypothetical protein JW996_01445 [Candidatus Cloacimonetes bacterium]|nr:hypothetical protein [Candidatus Cloacimonadota bacterium]